MLTHEITVRVRFEDIDAAGIAFYPRFFGWFDLGTHELLRVAGGSPLREAGGRPRWPFPIVDARASFSAPLLFDDEIVIRTNVSELGTSSLRLQHAVFRDGLAIADGFECRVYVRFDGSRLKAAPIPPELRRALLGGEYQRLETPLHAAVQPRG